MSLDALIVPTPAHLLISRINESHADRKLEPVAATDGRNVLSADLLTDCGPGQTWADYAAVLTVLDRETVEMPEPPPEA
jgi:hypothetical protein